MKKLVYTILCLLFFLEAFSQDEICEDITDFNYQLQNLTADYLDDGFEITIKPGEEGSIIFTPTNTYWDLREWVFLSVELENLTNKEVRFEPILQYDNPRRGANVKMVNNEHIGFLHPNENLIYNCVMIRDNINSPDYPQFNDFPGMKGLPDGVIMNYSGVDAMHIKEFKVTFSAQSFERKLVLKRILKNRQALPELYQTNKEAFFPFINKYGQYKHGTWEGKITDDSQFAEAIAKEEQDLAENPGSSEWNRFGGYASGSKYDATGHFRTQKINGKWWIIDPDGCLFWSVGINSAGKLVVSTPISGREHFFEGLDGQKTYNYGSENLKRKYGANSEALYTEICLKRMKSWGLNTLGGWSAETIDQYSESVKLPYTVFVNAITPKINDKFPDVFDPQWKTNVEKLIKEKAAVVKSDSYFFGFFINNEIHWGNPNNLASNSLKKSAQCAGKQEYVALLQKHMSSINEFNNLTGASFASWEALLRNENTSGMNISALNDFNKEHYTNMCEKYFKTTKELIDQYAPGKMYIGCRWHGNHKNEWNMAVGAKYLDIITINKYANEVEFFTDLPQSIDKPFIISEFNFGALDRGKFFTGLGYASSQRNRGEKYVNFIEGALRNPRCVGAHWFMWANSTTAGRGNGENANCGLVSATDQIYYELVDYMREITYQLYNYRINGSTTAVSVIHSEHNEEFKISPNPTNSLLNIQPIISNINAEIFNLNGQQVWNGRIVNGTINIEQLKSGIYILQFADNKRQNIFKIIKK